VKLNQEIPGMIHTNVNELIDALKLYRETYGDKAEIDLPKLEGLVLILHNKQIKRKKK